MIRGSKDPETAKNSLITTFSFSEKQTKAILDMRLQKLTSLETDKLIEEYDGLQKLIIEYKEVLQNHDKQSDIIKEELLEINDKYSDTRKTEIVPISGKNLELGNSIIKSVRLAINKIDDDRITDLICKHFDFKPFSIINHLNLKQPIYGNLGAYGHLGREGLPWETDEIDSEFSSSVKDNLLWKIV